MTNLNSRQEIQEYQDGNESISFKNGRGLESYMCALEDIRNLLEHINNSSIQYGTVAPESVITSNNSQLYFDTATSTLYTNPTISALTGWVAI